jgi:methionyl aminopeptidase
VAVVLHEIAARIKPGVTTAALDFWAEERLGQMHAQPAFKGYGASSRRKGFPATLCISVNDVVVHGIPSAQHVLKEGDIVSIDVGSIYNGWFGDAAWTYAVGDVSAQARKLMQTCQQALEVGIAKACAGNHLSDIGRAIESRVHADGFAVVRDLSGHGVGSHLHEEPQVLNFYDGQKGAKLKPRMTIAIEPMITAGSYEVKTLTDNWTVVTADNSLAAHYEHTVAITDNGPDILSRL